MLVRRAALCVSIGVIALGTLGGSVASAAAAGAGAAPGKLRAADGLHVVSQSQLDARLLTVSVSTPGLTGPANVRILLPTGYAAHPHRRYPVLYLLHGTSGGAADWTTMGDAEKTTAGLGLIVVMPDIALNDDGGGWCANWWNGGARGAPEWETFHIDELIPWVDKNLRTLATRDGRAIAGLSQGGFCSMSYAARHPDLFSTALAYSGAPDIAYDAEAQALVTPIINATELGLDGVAPNSIFGDRTTEEVNWADHDPTTLAENLRGMNLFMYDGNGQPGPYDTGVPNGEANVIEGGVQQLTELFHNRLQSLGIPSLYDDYGAGTHSWPYWARDLRWSIAAVMHDFAHPPPAPKAVTYTTADNTYSVFGWQVTMHRMAEEFSTLEHAGAGGFALAGSGSAVVITPGSFVKRARYFVTLVGTGVHKTSTVTADRTGRVQISVPLGPANPDQEYTAAAAESGTKVYVTSVVLKRVVVKRRKGR